MNSRSTLPLALGWLAGALLGLVPAFAESALSDYPDARSLAVEMRRLERAAGPTRLPPVWRVRTPGQDFSISSGGVTDANAKRWLASRAWQLERFDGGGPGANPAAAKELRSILDSPRFVSPVAHHWWDSYVARLNAWFNGLIRRFFGFIGKSPIGGGAVFWAALAACAVSIAWWVVASLRSDTMRLSLTGHPRNPHRTYLEWIAAMRSAQEEGDLRKAIQCAYWAARARLEQSGALRAGAARTPRESLADLASSPPSHAALASAAARPLGLLTAALERFWYGGGPATATDFSACLTSLEDLGCRLD